MKIKDYRCKCGCYDFFFNNKNNQVGIYCSYCGKWLKWADKDEQNLALKPKPNKSEIPTGSTTKSETLVSLDTYNQVVKERDIAIQQLYELGYEFGQKIEPITKDCLAVEQIVDEVIKKVMPIKPKGHWILTDVEGDKVWHCHCSECGEDPQDYVGGSENWWLIKSKLPKFCPSCGSDNRSEE